MQRPLAQPLQAKSAVGEAASARCAAGACARVCCWGAGETEEQFGATCALVREVGFDRVNTAAYSPRPATPAAEWENQVPHTDAEGFSAEAQNPSTSPLMQPD